MRDDQQDLGLKREARNPRAAKIGLYVAVAGVAVAVAVLLAGGGARGTTGTVLFGVVLAALAAAIGGAVLAGTAGRVPPASPEEARQRRSTAMIAWGVVALVLGLLGLVNWAPVGGVVALLGVALIVGGLVIRP